MEKMILDTNILIEILKGNSKIVNFLHEIDLNYSISSITAMELYYGARDKKELSALKKFIDLFEVMDIEIEISQIAASLVEKYAKSHTLDIPDALIAATAISKNIPLFTLNIKDFKFIKNLLLSNYEA